MDPFWPKVPLPNAWLVQGVLTPEIFEFDGEGDLINAWGGPDHHPLWPASPQAVDRWLTRPGLLELS